MKSDSAEAHLVQRRRQTPVSINVPNFESRVVLVSLNIFEDRRRVLFEREMIEQKNTVDIHACSSEFLIFEAMTRTGRHLLPLSIQQILIDAIQLAGPRFGGVPFDGKLTAA